MMIGYKTGLACILGGISPIVAAIAGWLWGVLHGGPSAAQSGLCDGCGYDLTGNQSGICPECGMAINKDIERKIEIYHVTPDRAHEVEMAKPDPDAEPVTSLIAVNAKAAVSGKTVARNCENPTPASKPFSDKEIEIS